MRITGNVNRHDRIPINNFHAIDVRLQHNRAPDTASNAFAVFMRDLPLSDSNTIKLRNG